MVLLLLLLLLLSLLFIQQHRLVTKLFNDACAFYVLCDTPGDFTIGIARLNCRKECNAACTAYRMS